MFARAWATWVAKNGGAAAVNNNTYLDMAERFVSDFLAGRTTYNGQTRPEVLT
jgi:hypothetical protein